MKIKKWSLFILSLLSFSFVTIAWAAQVSPLGTWTTIDDKTHKPRGVIQVTESNGTLYGKLIKIYPQPGDTGICLKCPGSFKNKKIKGLTVMWGLKKSGTYHWSGGQILDPKSGLIYSCKLTVGRRGKTLRVRGYIGIALIGRTQIWTRTNGNIGKEPSENKTQSINKPTNNNHNKVHNENNNPFEINKEQPINTNNNIPVTNSNSLMNNMIN